MKYLAMLLFPLLGLVPRTLHAEPNNPNTDWFRDAKYGVFMHFLPADAASLAQVREFDVEALSRQLETLGAKYFVITLGDGEMERLLEREWDDRRAP